MQKRFDSIANPATGRAIAGASVQVNVAGGGAATIYSDDGVTECDNPIITDANGYFEYFAADGLYDWVISGTGLTTRTIEDVLHEDPAYANAGVFDTVTVTDSISLGGVTAEAVSSMGALVLIEGKDGAGLTNVDFTAGIGSTYDAYLLVVSDLQLTSAPGSLELRVSQNAGASFISAANPYTYRSEDYNGTIVTVSSSAGASSIPVLEGLDAGQACSGEVRFYAPSNTSRVKLFVARATKLASVSTPERYESWGVFKLNTAAINAIRLIASSAIVAGGFALYGYRKA